MNLNLNATKEQFIEKLNGSRKVIVFGASGSAEKCWNEFELEGKVEYFVDNRFREFTDNFKELPEIASQMHPMQYAVAALNGTGVGITDGFEEDIGCLSLHR